jgi:hypothetical protein
MEANMQRRSLKFGVIISIVFISLLCFTTYLVYGTDENLISTTSDTTESNEVVAGSVSAEDENTIADTDDNSISEDNTVADESHDEDVYVDESSSNTVATTQTPSSSASTKQISSYSTVSTLPEANLGLNNILNVILIAIGVIIILLAIAILIRLKQ